MKIGIVGLGIGGATAGAAMALRGMDFTVFEQSPEIREVGAGLATWPNTIRLFNRMGLASKLSEIGSVNGESPVCNAQGDILHHISSSTYDGTPGYHVHRAELLEAVASLIPASRIRLGARCRAVKQHGDKVEVQLESGETESFDLVIGADGIRSAVLQAVTDAAPPIYSNLAAYRGLVPNDGAARLDGGALWTDRRQYFVAFPVSGKKLINFVGVVPTPGKPDESWFMAGNKGDLSDAYADWDPKVRAIVDKVDQTFLWGLYFREPLANIVKGRIALMGDAAHPMLIMAGQGVGQAIEDGVALAVLLQDATPEQAEERLRLYESFRLSRASEVQSLSRRNAQFMHADFPLLPGEARPDRAAVVNWIVNYDVEREAENLLRGL